MTYIFFFKLIYLLTVFIFEDSRDLNLTLMSLQKLDYMSMQNHWHGPTLEVLLV